MTVISPTPWTPSVTGSTTFVEAFGNVPFSCILKETCGGNVTVAAIACVDESIEGYGFYRTLLT